MILPKKREANELNQAVYICNNHEEVKETKGLIDLTALDGYMDPLPLFQDP